MRISICIPTYQRPDLLRECLVSCFRQSYPAFEILVGDDSGDDSSEPIAKEFASWTSLLVSYSRNPTSLGQAGNVDRLISNAKGDLVCLLHDDDLLEPSALERLSAPFADPCVVASFGKQIVVGHAGDERIEETQKLNFQCRRTSAHSGLQKDSLISAITGQFPNDGFLVRRAAAQQINYQSLETVFGHGCDYGFGISLALNHPVDAFYFVDEFTAKYRESKTSISRNNSSGSDSAFHCFRYVVDHMAGHHQNPEVHSYLCRQSAGAIAQAARLGYSKLALRWFFSPWHVSRMFSPGGVRRLCLIGVSFCKRRKT